MDITVMENLPTEMLLYIFEMLSYRDLKIAMLVCRRWREIGEIQQLWGSLPVIVNKRNISVMPEILSTTRLLGLHKLRIETDLSEKVSQTIARHPGLREFELSERNDEQTIISVLNVICSREGQGMNLRLKNKNVSGVDAELLASAVIKLETLEFSNTQLTQQQIVAILTAVSDGRKMTKLDISFNDMSGIDKKLLAKAVTKMKKLNITDTNLTQEQAEAILTAVSEENVVSKLYIGFNNLSGVDPGLMAKAFTNLKKLNVNRSELTHRQIVTILTAVSEAKTVMELDIGFNNLSGVDEGLLAKAVTNLKTLNVNRSKLTQRQIVTILTALIKGNTLHIGMNDLSRVDPGLLARTVNKLEVLDVQDTGLLEQQVVAIITAVSKSNKITELYMEENNLSIVDLRLLTKLVTKLVILNLENTKLTQQKY